MIILQKGKTYCMLQVSPSCIASTNNNDWLQQLPNYSMMATNGEGRRRLSSASSTQKEDSRGICALCHSHHSQLSIPAYWKSEEARCLVYSLQVLLNAVVCQPCRRDVTRVLANTSYVPRWRKGREPTSARACCVMDCTDNVFASLHKASEQVQSAFEAGELRSCEREIPVPTPLCKHHYHRVYKYIAPTQTHCVTCGISLKHSKSKVCPKPAVIEQFLKENTDFEYHIRDQDRVCYVCYRSHLITLQQSDNLLFSSDEDLQELIATLSDQVPLTGTVKVTTIQEATEAAMKRVVITVGKGLLDRNVFLLPSIHDLFCIYTSEILEIYHLKGDPAKLVTSRSVLSHLKVSLQNHIAYSCKTRKYGTLLYRPQTDLLTALAQTYAMLKLTNWLPTLSVYHQMKLQTFHQL